MLDFDELCEALGLDKEEFWEFARLFLDVARTDLKEIEKAMVSGDLDSIAQAAHSIKGAASTLDLEEIFALARELERSAKARQALELEGLFRTLKNEIDDLTKLLSENWEGQKKQGSSFYFVSSCGDEP